MHNQSVAVVSIIALLTAGSPVYAKSAQRKMDEQVAQLPTCTRTLGTLAIQEPEEKWWRDMGLGSPEALIKYFAAKSRCFRLVDRGTGLSAAYQERQIGRDLGLSRGHNVGKGQVKAADYVLVPDLITQNANAGGSAITGIAGSLLGGSIGAILGGIKITKKTANVTLSLVDVRTTEIRDVYEGHARKSDVGWAAGGGGAGSTGFGAAGGGGYTNTEQGKVIAAAYLDAFTKFAYAVGAPQPGTVLEPTAPAQALTVVSRANLRTGPSVKEAIVRTVVPGDLLYPTGQEAQGWREVQDEVDNKGWVSNTLLSPAK